MPDAKPIQYRIVDRSRRERARTSAPRWSRRCIGDARAHRAEVLLRRARLRALRRHLPAARVLPDAHRGRALPRAPRARSRRPSAQGRQFVDLGAGDCCKAQAWLPFVAPARYIAVDIAAREIARALARMAPDFPEVEMIGVVTDFTAGLPLERRPRRAAGHVLLSRLEHRQLHAGRGACAFLRAIHAHCARASRQRAADRRGRQEGQARVLDAAYDDALGRDRGVQPQRAAAPEPALRLRLRARRLRAPRASTTRPRAASRCTSSRCATRSVHLGERTRALRARASASTPRTRTSTRATEFEALLREAGFAARAALGERRTTAYFVFYAACEPSARGNCPRGDVMLGRAGSSRRGSRRASPRSSDQGAANLEVGDVAAVAWRAVPVRREEPRRRRAWCSWRRRVRRGVPGRAGSRAPRRRIRSCVR